MAGIRQRNGSGAARRETPKGFRRPAQFHKIAAKHLKE